MHNTTGNCYYCTKDGLLMQKRTHASSLPSFQTRDIIQTYTKDRDTLIEQSAGTCGLMFCLLTATDCQ